MILLLIGIYSPLLAFTALAIALIQTSDNFFFDEWGLKAIHATAHPWLDRLAILVTQLGGFWGILFLLSLVLAGLWKWLRWRSPQQHLLLLSMFPVVALLGNALINRLAKLAFHRTRPHLWEQLMPEPDFSFPSGHAMSSMTLVMTLLVLTWGTVWFWRVLLVGSGYVLLIGWTRLYLGVHFPSDIVAGWMIAIAWTISISVLLKPQHWLTRQQEGSQT